jgi:hypothetical protein
VTCGPGFPHVDLTAPEVHVPGYVQASDPGAVGAGKLWIDTSNGTGKWGLKIRNLADDGWELVDFELPSGTTVVNVNYYEVVDDDLYILVIVADDAEIVLPDAAANDGRAIHIKRTSENVYDVEVSTLGGLIEGAASFFLKHKYEAITCVSVNNDWWIY